MGAAAIGLLVLGLLLLLCEYPGALSRATRMGACAWTKHLCRCFRGRAHGATWGRGAR